jgi:hypothetical protein
VSPTDDPRLLVTFLALTALPVLALAGAGCCLFAELLDDGTPPGARRGALVGVVGQALLVLAVLDGGAFLAVLVLLLGGPG